MVEFTHRAETAASAEDVLAAARDFSPRRIDVWPNVSRRRYEVHAAGETFTEVTEGAVQGIFWERSRYEWSRPGAVHQTVVDSNVLVPGSTWELTVHPNGAGCRVEAAFRREFPRTPKGWFARLVNSRLGRRIYLSDLKKMLRTVESG
jgi:hypothetical protein